METVEIPLSKRKLLLVFAGSVLFVGLGTWFLMKPDQFVNPFSQHRTVVLIVGALAVLFFGLCAVVIFRKLFDKRMGLIIDSSGITDNSSGFSNGLVPWADITGIDTAQVQSQRFVLIAVTDPGKYIERQTGSFKKRMMKINQRMYGTPICITATGLQCSFDELYRTILQSFEIYKN